MKKVLKAGKKPLSLLLAVVMLITTWVFIAPTKAEAVNSGLYDVKISWVLDNDDGPDIFQDYAYPNKYTGWSSFNTGSDTNNKVGFSLYYKTDNGTGTEYEVWWDLGDRYHDCGKQSGSGATVSNPTGHLNRTKGDTYYCEAVLDGFPTRIHACIDGRNGGPTGAYSIREIGIRAHGTNNEYTAIFKGKVYLASTNKQYYCRFNNSKIQNNSNDYAKYENYNTGNGWKYPYATTVTIDQGIKDITVPKDGTNYSKNGTADYNLRAHAVDQYGVVIGSDAYATNYPSVKFDYSDNNGVKAEAQDTQSKYDEWKIGANNNAKMPNDSSKNVTATVTYRVKGTTTDATNTASFKLTDVKYRYTVDGNGGEVISPSAGYVETDYNNAFSADPLASWDGYRFLGFYSDKQSAPFYNETSTQSGTRLSKDTKVTENKTWYAAWRAKRNAVKFSYRTADGSYTTTAPVYGYYGKDSVAVPQDILKTIAVNGGDREYTFTGWDNGLAKDATSVAVQTGDEITYTAQYSVHNEYAKYDKVKTQIDRAELADDEEDFNDKYTDESLAAFNKALGEAREIYKEETENRKRGKSQQDYVDSFATNLKNAIDNLKIKHFTVLFVDDDGTIIKDGYHYVEYGKRIDVPTTPVREPDETYHYEFSEWRTADRLESAEVQAALEKVTADYRFVAKFNRFTHDYSGKPEVIESTCTVNGSLKYTCPGCGMTKVVANPDDIASHDFSRQVVVEATCSTNGATAMVCKDCGVYEEGTLEIVDKLDHNYGTWTTLTPATCWGKGTEKRTCANCDAYEVRETEKLDHAWDTEAEGADANGWVNVAATCEADGYRYRTCTACQLVQREKTTDKLDHPAANRVVDEVVATCKNAGYRLETCDLCGKVISFTTTAQLTTHTWDTTVAGADENGWVTVIAKSCTQKEVKKRVCSVCGKEEVAISADFLPHTEIKDAAVAATCTHTGLTEGKHCDVCKQVLVAQTETPALGHNYDSAWTTESEATCQSNGYEVQICDRDGCGEILDTRVIDAIDHVWDTSVEGADADGWVTTTAATCTEDGEAERTCIATTGHHHTETKVLPKLGHDWGEWTQSKAPTCTEPGEEQRVCGNDNTHVETRKVPATGHNYTTDVKQPTCTDAGYTKHTCACGDEYFTDIVNPNGHHFVEDKTAYVEPTNTQPGQKVFYCDNDGCTVRYTVELAPQGHTFAKDEANSQAPKCTEPGWNTFKCTAHENCGIKYREELPELGHHFVLDHEKTIPASCLTDGTNAYKCDRDGCTATMTETVKAVGHDMQFVEHIDADCIHYGRDIYKCSKCNYTEERQIDTEKPTGTHDFGVLLVVAPTCTQQGFTVFKCRVCDATFRGDFKDPLGHAWDEGHHVDPTCTEPGGTLYTCTRTETYVDENGKTQTKQCGATKLEDEEPALGHDMGQWYFAADGDHYVNKRDCNRDGCPYSEYEEINGEKVVYYKVDFVSYKYVGEYYTAGDGTKLAYSMDEQPNAYKEVVVDTQYIKSGEPCEYAGEKLELPKTKAFGVYNLTGWKLDKGDLSNVTTNITAKAQFQGEEIYYEVNFYSYDGHLVKGPVHVLHGHPVAKDDRPFDEYVTRPNNNQYKYEFTGKWDKDIEAIYSTGPIHAVFKQIPLTYKVVFHDWDGKVVATQILGYGEGVNDATKAAFSTMKRDEDDAYIYEWTPASRRWVDAKGNIIDENHVKVPDNQGYQEYTPEKEKDEFLSDREKGIFHVYASYPQKIKYYRFNVSAKYADGSIAEGATVTVQSPDGQLVYTTKLNEKGTATVTVEHYEYVTVNITGGGETNSLKIGLGKDNIVDGYFGNEGDEIPSFAFELSNYVDPDPDHGGSTKCRCICHTFLGGLWINFLNILYRLFGKKTVCCHDMYEKHGDRLAYGK